MKKKILETEVSDACEIIAKALRKYTDEPLSLVINIDTREAFPEIGTDFYSFYIRDPKGELVLELGRRAAYCWDDENGGREVIRETYNSFGGVDDGTEEGL